MKNKITRIILTLLLFNLVILLHETGHFIAMNQYGVEVETFSVGVSLPFIPTYERKVSAYPHTRFRFSPMLLGGYVEASKHGKATQGTLPVVAQAHIFSAGIEMNLYVAMAFLCLSYVLNRRGNTKPIRVSLIVGSTLCLALLVYAPFVEIIILPTIGLTMVIFLLITRARTFEGPIRLFRSFTNSSQSLKELLLSFAILNVDLFTLNAIPLLPADGGHTIEMLLSRFSERVSHLFIALSFAVVLTFVVGLTAMRLIKNCEQKT